MIKKIIFDKIKNVRYKSNMKMEYIKITVYTYERRK